MFLGRSVTKTTHMSEATMQKVDTEIRRIIDEQYSVARKILEDNRDKVEVMTSALLEWETIDADQINDIIEGRPPRPPKTPQGPSDTSDTPPISWLPAATRQPPSEVCHTESWRITLCGRFEFDLERPLVMVSSMSRRIPFPMAAGMTTPTRRWRTRAA